MTDKNSVTIKEALSLGVYALRENNNPYSFRDALGLLSHLLGESLEYVMTHNEECITSDKLKEYLGLIERRNNSEPIQYIKRISYFWKDSFVVTPSVLIPRPETEIIVEEASRYPHRSFPIKIIDIGTGSGCIGLSLLREIPLATVLAVDISINSLQIARLNAKRLGMYEKFSPVASDGFSALKSNLKGCVDIVVSNPPYIDFEQFATLPAEISKWEPGIALKADMGGLIFYEKWIPESLEFLKSGGWLFMEFGQGQWGRIEEVCKKCGYPYKMFLDLNGYPRTFRIEKI